jgi:hypothetical protein
MAYPQYLRDKARQLRRERHLSIVEIGERLALPKTTIYYWVRDLPLGRPRNASAGQRRGNMRMRRRYQAMREAAYEDGRAAFASLAEDQTFRDFVCMYIGEGYKRDRNVVSIGNSDPRVVALGTRWLRALASNKLMFSVQYHADQDLAALRRFWGATLEVDAETIRLQRKSNSGKLSRRIWRCKYGVCTVRTSDTLLRARLQAWMDCVQQDWLDSPRVGA